jgi:hypothetical protein
MARHQRPQINDDGWTDWIYPHMDDYKLACCDCGLVHDMQLKVVRVKHLSNKTMLVKESRSSVLAVSFRARRNVRATAQTRRWQKKIG